MNYDTFSQPISDASEQAYSIRFQIIILSFWLLYLLLEKSGLFKNLIMEKNIDWHQITYETQQDQVPTKRWGHKTVYLQDQIVLFGGFSDVTYLSDLWAYNIHTNQWRQIETKGKQPEGKSNFTMHFDHVSNQLIIFGGGGPNKRRFNKISLLDWQTKVWTQFSADDQNSPWQRTYHSSEFKYPFLITFGGEGAANLDFDDLWAFNIESKAWVQIKASVKNSLNTKQQKIQGRRFHSTAMINDVFYVISGCRINYSCIPNIFSIDLKQLFYSENTSPKQSEPNEQQMSYHWKRHDLSETDLQLVERWGHSSEAYNNKIYIFGGRNKDDYNDLLQFDPITNKVRKIDTNGQNASGKIPKSRRRHSSCLIGASMIIFGGFNIEYFNDMQYISLFGCRDNFSKQKQSMDQEYQIIELQKPTFLHFMEQMSKDKSQYDIEIYFQSLSKKQQFVVKSMTSCLAKNSLYFQKTFKYNSNSNPQRKSISLSLDSANISIAAFHIFNAFMIKDILILPKKYKLNRLYQLLICADYFQHRPLFELIQKVLTVKVINQTQNVDDIFNIAANWKMIKLLKICSQKKILNRTFVNSYGRTVGLSYNAARLKQKFIEQMLMQIQFDEIQKGQKKRMKDGKMFFGKNIQSINLVAEQKGLPYQKLNHSKRKKSFVQKFVQSISKIYSSSSSSQVGKLRQSYSVNVDDSDEQQSNEVKLF